LLEEDGPDETDDGVFVGEDPGDVGAALERRKGLVSIFPIERVPVRHCLQTLP
jgi:hypothetical protein